MSLDLNCILGVMLQQRNIVSASIIGNRLINFSQALEEVIVLTSS